MAERVLIWGAGGHGRVVADLVRATGREVVGYVDADPAKRGAVVEPGGARVVMLENELMARVRDDFEFDETFALGIGDNGDRLRALQALRGRRLPALVHPVAAISPTAVLAPGTVVLAGAVVNAAAEVGAGGIVNSGAVVEHDCVLGDAVHISPNATLAGGVRIGERAWVGAGAVVLPGVRVGADAVVGAGAVVLEDVPPGATVVGNPARFLRGPAPDNGSSRRL